MEQTVELMMECLLAKMNANREEIMAKMETQIGNLASQMNVNQNKWDNGHEERKAQVGSLASWMDAYLEEMKAWQTETKAC
jgi:hypothetical protein